MIHRLSARPELAAETAALMTRTWPSHYGQIGGGDAIADVQSRIDGDRAAVALKEDRVVGTVAMAATSFGRKTEGPWLVGLCTAAAVRGQGYGTALVTWTAGNARKAGHPALYTTTQDAIGIFERLGWSQIRTVTDETGEWSVWKIKLVPDPDGSGP